LEEIYQNDLFEKIERALDTGDLKEALVLSHDGIKKFPKNPNIWALRAEALDELGEIYEAVDAYSRALKYAPDWGPGYSRRSSLHIETGNLESAKKDIERSLALNNRDPEALFNLAIIHELDGNEVGARSMYRKSCQVDPYTYFMPVRVSHEVFKELLSVAIENMPSDFREYLSYVSVAVHDLPERNRREGWNRINPLTTVEIIGEPVPEKFFNDPWFHFPAIIILYKKNLERSCRNTAELISEIQSSLLDEISFFLGFEIEEDDM
jgi:tetratricopeptide (TPR) repeat protein